MNENNTTKGKKGIKKEKKKGKRKSEKKKKIVPGIMNNVIC